MVAHLLNTVSLQTAFTQQNGDLTAKHEIDRVHWLYENKLSISVSVSAVGFWVGNV